MYLTMSEAGFREQRLGDVQMLFAKPRWAGDVRGEDRFETEAVVAA
jgi:hypothetical protein